MNNRATYYVFGILFSCMSTLFIVDFIMTHELLVDTYTTAAFAVMCFSMGYLHPQLKKKDERIRFIRQKALLYSFMGLAIYFIALTLLLTFNIVSLTALQVITILATLMMATVFLLMAILSKLH